MVPSTVKSIPWTGDFHVDNQSKTVRLKPNGTILGASRGHEFSNSRAMQVLLQLVVSKSTIPSLKKLHTKNETYPVLGTSLGLNIDRSACYLFGIVTAGAHMTVYTQAAKGQMKIWVPRRAWNNSKNPVMLDSSVAGGIASGETPGEAIVREAVEEASLDEDLVR